VEDCANQWCFATTLLQIGQRALQTGIGGELEVLHTLAHPQCRQTNFEYADVLSLFHVVTIMVLYVITC